MGEVYRARDSALERDVAIKVLPATLVQDPDRLRRFKQEAQAAAALNHPNILSSSTLANRMALLTSFPSCSKAKPFASACN